MPRIDPDNPPEATAARRRRGCAPVNFRRSSTTADSPASASRASTAASACPSSISGHSTTSPASYELPIILNTPTFTICAATILDTGSEEQKRQHISGALRGDEVLVQLLSEPSGGSDLAGVITRADRTGRQMGDQRRKDVEHQRIRRRLRADAGPHRLGRAQARGPDDVPGAHQQPRHHTATDQAGQRICRVLRGVLRQPRTRRRRRRRRGQRGLARGVAAALSRAARGRRRLGVRQRHRRRGQDRRAHRLGRASRSRRARPTTNGPARWPAARSFTGRCASS